MRKEDTVKLISAEGFEFVIDRKAALVSNTLKNMLTSTVKRMSSWALGSYSLTDTYVMRFLYGKYFSSKFYLKYRDMLEKFLRTNISGSFTETTLGEVRFPEISTPVLEKVCQYFYWSLQYASGKETEFHIEPEITLELMMAANYLHT